MVEAGCKLTAGAAGTAVAAAAATSAAGGATADSGSSTTASGGGEVVCVFPVELLYAYHHDVDWMAAFIDQRLSPAVFDRLPTGSSSSLTSSLAPTVSRLRSLAPLLLSSLTALLSSAAAVPLSAVPRLTQIYRMSKKSPTAPSPYVAQLIATLAKQQQQHHADTSQQQEELQQRWQHELARLVVCRVCELWSERVQSVLDVTLKMEASLRLLKKKAADGASGGEASEVDKIRGQLGARRSRVRACRTRRAGRNSGRGAAAATVAASHSHLWRRS